MVVNWPFIHSIMQYISKTSVYFIVQVLPEALPMKGRQYMKSKGKLVFLRNSIGKDWPVVYHDRYSRQVLACGWEAFKQANNIHAGDECSFEVDDIQKRIFCVRVLNR